MAGVPQPLLYVTTVVPVNTPPNWPVTALMVPVAGTLLLQVPLVAASDTVVVLPGHTAGVPAIAAGLAFTVTDFDALQPPTAVRIMDVTPCDIEFTTPVGDTVATPGTLLDQVPDDASDMVIDEPRHTDVGPDIAATLAVTVAMMVALQPPAFV